MMERPHVPFPVPTSVIERRALSSDDFATGGALAGGRLLDSAPTPIRRPLAFAERLGVEFLPNLEGNQSVALVVQRGKMNLRWRDSEDEAPAQSTNPRQGQVVLYPHELTGWLDVNRQSLLQTGPMLEEYLRAELRAAVMEALERALLQGSGEGAPMGIVHNDAVTVVNFTDASAPTRDEIVDAIGAVTSRHVPRDGIVAVMAPEYATALRKRPVIADSDRFMVEADMLVNTVRYDETGNCPAETMVLGYWPDVVVGQWDQIELMLDPYSRSTSGTVRVTVNHTAGIGYRRPGDFVKAE